MRCRVSPHLNRFLTASVVSLSAPALIIGVFSSTSNVARILSGVSGAGIAPEVVGDDCGGGGVGGGLHDGLWSAPADPEHAARRSGHRRRRGLSLWHELRRIDADDGGGAAVVVTTARQTTPLELVELAHSPQSLVSRGSPLI